MTGGARRQENAGPDALARRFEAVVFDWDGTAVADRESDASSVRTLVEGLCAAGMDVVVVSGTHVDNVDGQLAARPSGPGRLHLLLNRGSEVFRVDAEGAHLLHRRVATGEENAALDAAAAEVVHWLGRQGLEARVVSQRLNRRKIDLIPSWIDPPKASIEALLEAVLLRLEAGGLRSLREIVEIAGTAARQVGLESPKVTSDVKHVEIGLTDKADSALWVYRDLWARGVSPGLVLIAGDEFGFLGGAPGSDSLMLIPELARATAVSVGVEPAGVPAGVIGLGGGPDRFCELLGDQLARRERGDVPAVDLDPRWTISFAGLDPDRERAREALMTLGDGQLGTSGSPPGRYVSAAPRVLAAGFYARAGARSELAACPVWTALPFDLSDDSSVRRTIDLRSGVLRQEVDTDEGNVEVVQFSSLDRPGMVVLRATGPDPLLRGGPLLQRPRGVAWGSGRPGDVERMKIVGSHEVLTAVAAEEVRPGGLDRFAVYRRGSTTGAVDELADAEDKGFDGLLSAHRARWAQRWATADVVIQGDDDLQRSVRFALFHLIGQVGDHGEAAVGARGTTGPAYRGHVFWDADVFVLPFLAATHPEAARAMLAYRINRLPAALEAAAARGQRGARFPWESAADGYEVTPASVRDFSGRLVPIRARSSEVHITADIAWAADCYVRWSGDEAFARGDGKKLWIETARYWAGRIRMHGGAAHIYGVVGPDEYHETVDDNAYTNVMARWNLRRAAAVDDVDPGERRTWLELADALLDGYQPSTGVYEQFAGFNRLQPLLIAEIAARPVPADALLGRRVVNGAQIIKQADVLMLHHLVPEEVAPGSLLPNLEFYEPRTAHGSSLSPGIHAALFARAGRPDAGLPLLRLAANVDLVDNTSTTAGGLHLAAMGATWQALAFGYAGVRVESDVLHVDPRLPEAWQSLELRLRFRGAPVTITVSHEGVSIVGDARVEVHT